MREMCWGEGSIRKKISFCKTNSVLEYRDLQAFFFFVLFCFGRDLINVLISKSWMTVHKNNDNFNMNAVGSFSSCLFVFKESTLFSQNFCSSLNLFCYEYYINLSELNHDGKFYRFGKTKFALNVLICLQFVLPMHFF